MILKLLLLLVACTVAKAASTQLFCTTSTDPNEVMAERSGSEYPLEGIYWLRRVNSFKIASRFPLCHYQILILKAPHSMMSFARWVSWEKNFSLIQRVHQKSGYLPCLKYSNDQGCQKWIVSVLKSPSNINNDNFWALWDRKGFSVKSTTANKNPSFHGIRIKRIF